MANSFSQLLTCRQKQVEEATKSAGCPNTNKPSSTCSTQASPTQKKQADQRSTRSSNPIRRLLLFSNHSSASTTVDSKPTTTCFAITARHLAVSSSLRKRALEIVGCHDLVVRLLSPSGLLLVACVFCSLSHALSLSLPSLNSGLRCQRGTFWWSQARC